MTSMFSICFAIALLNSSGKEIEEFLQSIPKASEKQALEFIESIDPAEKEKKCPCSSQVYELADSQSSSQYKLFMFISFSVPIESWKEHSHFLEQAGGVFVLRGLPENSFTTLAQKMMELRKAGVHAEIILDPSAFEKYAIQAVPSLVLDTGTHYDKALGNSRIPAILALFSNSGDTKDAAQNLLKKGGKGL